MNVISIENISKTLKDEPLFSNVTFGIDQGNRLGVTGKNGCGKSTLLKILNGDLLPDDGRIAINKDAEVRMLDQTTAFEKSSTIKSFLLETSSKRIDIYKKLLSGKQFDFPEELDPWSTERDYISFLQLLGVKEDLSTPLNLLSGGTRKKTAIARLLTTKASILILDEPTNHLDIISIEWLENYLKSCGATIILVTHDRYFLNSVSTHIAEIDRHQLFMYPGDYSSFLEKREMRMTGLLKEQEKLKTILHREVEWLHQGAKARTGKDQGRKDRIEQMQNRQEQIIPDQLHDFSSVQRRIGKKILELEDISITRSNNKLIDSFTFSFLNGQRIGVIGPNGSGKSTLLEIIAGKLTPDGGIRDAGINTFFGYYDQLAQHLPMKKNPLEYISELSDNIRTDSTTVVTAARFLELFDFPTSFHRIPIEMLSGGERKRLYLIACLAKNPNFLLLDEPTNDLDLDTIRKLEDYVLNFPGVVVTVSHDRAFLDRVCDELLVLPGDSSIVRFPGTFSNFRQENPVGYGEEKEEEKTEKIKYKPRKNKKTGPSFNEKKEFEKIGIDIEKLESKKETLEAYFSTGNIEGLAEKQKEYNSILSTLDKYYKRWEKLAEIME